jgi:hypothetical protein
VCLYQTLKQVCIEVCLSLFLGIDFDTTADLTETIVSLTTTHWHGELFGTSNIK